MSLRYFIFSELRLEDWSVCSSQHPPAAARGGIPHGFLISGGSQRCTVLLPGEKLAITMTMRIRLIMVCAEGGWRAQWLEGWELHQLWGAEGNLPKGELPEPTFVTKTEL